MAEIRSKIQDYPFISMDTEFPGIVARPMGSFCSQSEYAYQTLRCNVDLLRIIQLGLTLSDGKGNLPEGVCTWQFNFNYNLDEETYAQDSIDLLVNSGIDFEQLALRGIDIHHFGELIMSSGLVLMPNVHWITFHSSYDFGYFLKVVTCRPLPADEADFFDLLNLFFPCIYDMKQMVKSCAGLKGGLQDIADDLKVSRIGTQHQAGSDSLVTCLTFFKLIAKHFDGIIDQDRFKGLLFGLGASIDSSSTKPITVGPSNNPFLSGAFSGDVLGATPSV